MIIVWDRLAYVKEDETLQFGLLSALKPRYSRRHPSLLGDMAPDRLPLRLCGFCGSIDRHGKSSHAPTPCSQNMAFRTAYKDSSKITVTLPKALLVRLDEYVPSRKRSRFIAEAIETRLALAEQLLALDETAGAWSDDNHPEMKTEEDIDRWIDDIRASWSPSGGEHHG